ncbi:VF530 family DNA-binding protein [Craterilacuibacter sp.]|uniref:VF530 family protein n=1 Tax=Craterilacuibacter sp. TaxID=2870909 RepID=UPI003F32495A
MTSTQPDNPMHGITLEAMLVELVECYGWEDLGKRIKIRCFTFQPSIKTSLIFLRRTPWARTKVEALFTNMKAKQARALAPRPASKPAVAPVADTTDTRPRLFSRKS